MYRSYVNSYLLLFLQKNLQPAFEQAIRAAVTPNELSNDIVNLPTQDFKRMYPWHRTAPRRVSSTGNRNTVSPQLIKKYQLAEEIQLSGNLLKGIIIPKTTAMKVTNFVLFDNLLSTFPALQIPSLV